MRHESVLDAIGQTPLVRLRLPATGGVEVYAKLELQNLFAMKDRVARQVILDARESGALVDGGAIVESSSGTMALGLALVGRFLGHPVHIVTDPRIDPITLAKLETLGCAVHVVETMTSQGWQSARLERLADLMAELPGAFWPRQYTNPQNPIAYRALARELLADLGRVDVIVGSVGSGGSLCGTSRALLPDLPDLRVVAVDAVGSVLFAQPDVPSRKQSGLGNSLYPGNLDHTIVDEVHWLSDAEAFDATRRLAGEQQIFGGNTSGSVYRILTHVAAHAAPGTRIVGILPDRGDRYIQSVFRADLDGPLSTVPVEVPYGTTVSSWSYSSIPRRTRPVLLFVESNTTGTGMLALRTAARLGLAPVLATNNPARYRGLDDTGATVIECDTEDSEAIRAALAEREPDRALAGVITTSEFYLVRVAELTAAAGLPGNLAESAAACRNKALTRSALANAAVPQPKFVVVRDIAEVDAAIAAVGLPCVVKPADESGSHDVLWCADRETVVAQVGNVLAVVRNVRDQPTAGVALIEEFLDGPEFSAEMFCLDGEMTCVGVTGRTVSALPHFVETGHLFPADLPVETADAIAETARQALKVVGVDRGAVHVEVKLTAAGPAIVEINARLAGGMIPELIRLATGIDLLEQHLRAAAGRPVRLEPLRHRYAGIRFLISPGSGTLIGVTGLDRAQHVSGVEQAAVTVAPGKTVGPVRDAYDRLGYVIAVGTTPADVARALDEATAQVDIVVEGTDQ
jgi:cysteine synthase/biotin carboxylase